MKEIKISCPKCGMLTRSGTKCLRCGTVVNSCQACSGNCLKCTGQGSANKNSQNK